MSRRSIRTVIEARVSEILDDLRPKIMEDVRRTFLADLLPSEPDEAQPSELPQLLTKEPSARTAAPIVVPRGPLGPETVQQVMNQVSPFAKASGIARLNDGTWRCVHCKRTFSSQRGASMHVRSCEERPRRVHVSHRHTSRVKGKGRRKTK